MVWEMVGAWEAGSKRKDLRKCKWGRSCQIILEFLKESSVLLSKGAQDPSSFLGLPIQWIPKGWNQQLLHRSSSSILLEQMAFFPLVPFFFMDGWRKKGQVKPRTSFAFLIVVYQKRKCEKQAPNLVSSFYSALLNKVKKTFFLIKEAQNWWWCSWRWSVFLSSLLLLLLTKNTRFAKLWQLLESSSFHNSPFSFRSSTHWSTKLTYPIPL